MSDHTMLELAVILNSISLLIIDGILIYITRRVWTRS